MTRRANSQKRSEWQDRMRRFSGSKLSVVDFCRREKVSTPSFYQWRRKLADVSPDAKRVNPTATATFVPVQVAMAGEIVAVFPNGVRVTLPVHDQQLVRLSIESIAMARTNQGEA